MEDSGRESVDPPLPPYPAKEEEISLPPIGHVEEKLGEVLARLTRVDNVIRHLPWTEWHVEACFRIHEMQELTHDALGDKAFVARRMWVPPPPRPVLRSQLHTASSSRAQGDAPFIRRHQ